ncbi:Glycosyltransferase involved in cell wall bisynthesis [Amycolatopsis marina]|uniref:Glycosyltransferase involved in cell wall bisynthesis n=2 Tax=Amycolatopsis marina TaxID=490629 RepID=A0A1I0ZCH6_9PSEU|nr:Glycosyltransferase involved in cell wall bisynthesis [Amycolatopsis marina]
MDGLACPVTVVVPTRDEERCLTRCLDSVIGRGFDNIVVVDTGSVDKTIEIVDKYTHHGVQLSQLPWPDSFGEMRNSAIEIVGSGWIVFLDADEWLDEHSSEQLRRHLASLTGTRNSDRLTLAPIIKHVGREVTIEDVPRIFKADSGIRYRGAVHEYPVLRGTIDEPVDLASLDVVFHHDGYDQAVVNEKSKRSRNLRLLNAARKDEPDNPRWLYFTVRDGLSTLDHAQLIDLCTALKDLSEQSPTTGDRLSARHYYRRALCIACQGLGTMGDWSTVHRFCEELDRIDQGNSPDAHYFRSVAELFNGVVTDSGLLRTIALRREDELLSASTIDPAGRHLDALIVAILRKIKSRSDAESYRALCEPWTDAFFQSSNLRTW